MKNEDQKTWRACLLLVWLVTQEIVRQSRSPRGEVFALLRTVCVAIARRGQRFGLKKLLETIGLPNYRKKTRLKLGRPSPNAFKKLAPLFAMLPGYPNQAARDRIARVKILVIRDGAMGDVLMATPVIRELYLSRHPRVILDVATKTGDVFLNSPYVNEVIPVKELARKTREYDLVVDLNGVYENSPKEHPVEAYARVALGWPLLDKKLDLFPSLSDTKIVDRAVKSIGADFLVVHCPNHQWPNRQLPRPTWRAILKKVALETGLRIIQIGTSKDVSIDDCPEFENHLEKYSIHQICGLISRSRGFIGLDAGPSHIAASTDAPICVFYTCAHHETRKPLRDSGRFLALTPEIECYGCLTNSPLPRPGYFCKRGDNACTEAFHEDRVAAQIVDFVRSSVGMVGSKAE